MTVEEWRAAMQEAREWLAEREMEVEELHSAYRDAEYRLESAQFRVSDLREEMPEGAE